MLFLILTLMTIGSCGQGTNGDVERQTKAVVGAEMMVEEETVRLTVLRDSLEARAQDTSGPGMSRAVGDSGMSPEVGDSGMSPEVADSLMRRLLESQEAVVNAAAENLRRQRTYLEALKLTR